MLASCSSLALGRPTAAFSSQRAAFRPAHIAPVVARRSQLVVCQAAEVVDVEAAPVVSSLPKEGVAHLNFQRGSAHKARRVLDCIRGRTYEDAIMMMEYMPHRMCEKIIKALKSAAANAKENRQAAKSKLVVAECFADEGPVMKRFQPRSQGRAYRILKPTFHMTIRLAEQ